MAEYAPRDPRPYDGPIARADGTRPFNGYLWPTEQWVARDELDNRWLSFDWRVEIFALADGRFASSGFVADIEDGRSRVDSRPCVFLDRPGAIRASAAGMIRLARRALNPAWRCSRLWRLEDVPIVIPWARELVARETASPTPRAIGVRMPKIRKVARTTAAKTDLPLFDWAAP